MTLVLAFFAAFTYAFLGGFDVVPKPWYVIVVATVVGAGALSFMAAPS